MVPYNVPQVRENTPSERLQHTLAGLQAASSEPSSILPVLDAGIASAQVDKPADLDKQPVPPLAVQTQYYHTTFEPRNEEKAFDVVAGWKTAHKAPKNTPDRDLTDDIIRDDYRGYAKIRTARISAVDVKLAEGLDDPGSMTIVAHAAMVRDVLHMDSDLARIKTAADYNAKVIDYDYEKLKLDSQMTAKSPAETLHDGLGVCTDYAMLNNTTTHEVGKTRENTRILTVHVTHPDATTDLHDVELVKMRDGKDYVVNSFQPTVVTANRFFSETNVDYPGIRSFQPLAAYGPDGVQIYEDSRRFKPVPTTTADIVSPDTFSPHDRAIYDRVMTAGDDLIAARRRLTTSPSYNPDQQPLLMPPPPADTVMSPLLIPPPPVDDKPSAAASGRAPAVRSPRPSLAMGSMH